MDVGLRVWDALAVPVTVPEALADLLAQCLEKDRARRYDTANGLAMDVLRHLQGEPVLAAPPGRAPPRSG